jgi:hypothetical protein
MNETTFYQFIRPLYRKKKHYLIVLGVLILFSKFV